MNIELESKYEHEKQQLKEVHAHEIEEIQGRIDTTVLDKREVKTLEVVKDQALIPNSHLRASQLDYPNQVERLQTYHSQGKTLLKEVTQQDDIHTKVKAALQRISGFQKENLLPPPGILKLGKDKVLKYRYTIELWKFEVDVVKYSLEKAEDLIEGVWNTCSDVIDEWGIDEIEESLETFTPEVEDVEQVRASSEADINNLSVLDSEAMEFSVISPSKMTTRVE